MTMRPHHQSFNIWFSHYIVVLPLVPDTCIVLLTCTSSLEGYFDEIYSQIYNVRCNIYIMEGSLLLKSIYRLSAICLLCVIVGSESRVPTGSSLTHAAIVCKGAKYV